MKHIKKFNEDLEGSLSRKELKKSLIVDWEKELKKLEKNGTMIDPRIIAANLKNNIGDFSEAKIIAMFVRYANQ